MFVSIKRLRLKRAAVLSTTVLVGLVGAVVLAGPASAHDFVAVGSTTACDASTGTYTITYTGQADYALTSTVTVDSATPAGSTVAPHTQHVSAVTSHGGGEFTLVQTGVPGTATSASVAISELWSDQYLVQKTASVTTLAGTCAKSATPTFSDDVCSSSVPSGASYTIPSTPGVIYKVDGRTVSAGIHTVSDNKTVTITAYATNGYTLSGPTTFTHTFGKAPTCTTTTQAVSPTFSNDVCTGYSPAGASYTIPITTGVIYKVNGNVVTADTYSVHDGDTVTITASAALGYVLSGPTSFSHTFTAAPTCTTTTQAVSPTFSNDVCTNYAPTGAGYTIPITTGVIYKVNGTTVKAGTYPAADGSTVTVTASAAEGYTLTGTTTFTHVFGSQPTCTTAAVVVKPGFTDDVCTDAKAVGASYTVPAVTGVVYLVNGVAVATGIHPATDGSTVAITTQAAAGYTLSGTTSFTHTFAATPTCVVASAGLAFTGTSTSVPATVGIGAALLAIGVLLVAGARRLGRRTN